MDMRISGSGKIPAGEYNNISSSGSVQLYGRVRCKSFRSSGSSRGEDIECSESFKSSGSASFKENIKAKNIRVSGSLFCKGDIFAEGKLSCSGSAKCEKRIKCEELSVSGSLYVGDGITAENVNLSGGADCGGLLNAENITIKADKLMNIGSIGGTNILLKRKKFSIHAKRGVKVASSIEGDNIVLDSVTCPRVTGRTVVIGKGCKIDLVQYSEQFTAFRGAKIGRIEKI